MKGNGNRKWEWEWRISKVGQPERERGTGGRDNIAVTHFTGASLKVVLEQAGAN